MDRKVQSHIQDVLPFLKETKVFSVLDDSALEEVATNSQFHRIKKKCPLCKEGDKPAGGFVMGQGRLILKRSSGLKKAVVSDLIGKGEPFGMVCSAREEPYPFTAEALCESLVLSLDQDFLVSFCKRKPEFSTHLFDLCRARFRAAQLRFAELSYADAKARVIGTLLLYSRKFSAGGDCIVGVTREELSRIAGVTVETCIRITKKLEKQNFLSFPEKKMIELRNPAGLAALSA